MIPGSESRRYLGAVLLSNFFASIAFSILSPAMVANLVQVRTSALLIAVATSIWALPSAVGGPFYTRFIARYSARRWLVIGVFVYALVLLSFPFIRGIWAWIALQLVSGIALGHFFIVCGAWVNHFSPETARGRVTAIYGILPAVGYAIGSGIYALVGFEGFAPFVVAALAMVLGSVPLMLLRGNGGDAVVGGEQRLWATARLVPLLLLVAFIAGVLETSAWGGFQVYAFNSGVPVSIVGRVVGTFFAGQIFLTYPMGWIADRVDRRRLLVATAGISLALMGAMNYWGTTWGLWFIVFSAGGIFNAVYTLGLAAIGQRFDVGSLVSAGAAYMTAYSVGATFGSPIIGALMDHYGAVAMPVTLGAASALVLLAAAVGRAEWSPAGGQLPTGPNLLPPS